MTTDGLSRRHALAGAAGLGLSLPLLAACGGGGSSSQSPAAAGGSPGGGGGGGGGGNGGSNGGGGGGVDLGPTSKVAEGSGTIYPDQNVVVTQPAAGEFKCFSAICTHQGCQVSTVSDTINCGCHGSRFSIKDGSVVVGPAVAPLAEKQIKVKGGDIKLA